MKPYQYVIILTIAVIAIVISGCKKDSTNAGADTNKPGTSILPVANFTFTIANDHIFPCEVEFTNTSQNAVTSTWDMGDNGLYVPNGLFNIFGYAYNTPRSYSVTLTVTDGVGNKSVLVKTITFSSVAISGINTYKALPNAEVIISGANLPTNGANEQVTFNGVLATIVAASSTQIAVIVPATATTGKVVITINGIAIMYPTDFVVGAKEFATLQGITLEHISNGSNPVAIGIELFGTKKDSTYINVNTRGPAIYSQSYSQAVLPPSRLWGMIGGASSSFVSAPDEYKIYSTTDKLASSVVFAGSGVQGYADGPNLAAQFMSPKGLTSGTSGWYVADSNRVRLVTPKQLVTTFAGSGIDGNADGLGMAASFGSLTDITSDLSGNLYVIDTKYHNIRKITSDGTVTTFAGGTVQGLTDGTGKAAQFYAPKGITADEFGNIYVTDSNYTNASTPFTSTVRMIDASGIVSTILSTNKGDQLGKLTDITYQNGILYLCTSNSAGIPQPVIYITLY